MDIKLLKQNYDHIHNIVTAHTQEDSKQTGEYTFVYTGSQQLQGKATQMPLT